MNLSSMALFDDFIQDGSFALTLQNIIVVYSEFVESKAGVV